MFVTLNSFAYNTFLVDQNALGIWGAFGSKEFHRILTRNYSFGKFSQNAVWNKGIKNSEMEETFLQLLISREIKHPVRTNGFAEA